MEIRVHRVLKTYHSVRALDRVSLDFLRSSVWVFVDVLLGCAVLALRHNFAFAK